jgi:hypothetical protein
MIMGILLSCVYRGSWASRHPSCLLNAYRLHGEHNGLSWLGGCRRAYRKVLWPVKVSVHDHDPSVLGRRAKSRVQCN